MDSNVLHGSDEAYNKLKKSCSSIRGERNSTGFKEMPKTVMGTMENRGHRAKHARGDSVEHYGEDDYYPEERVETTVRKEQPVFKSAGSDYNEQKEKNKKAPTYGPIRSDFGSKKDFKQSRRNFRTEVRNLKKVNKREHGVGFGNLAKHGMDVAGKTIEAVGPALAKGAMGMPFKEGGPLMNLRGEEDYPRKMKKGRSDSNG